MSVMMRIACRRIDVGAARDVLLQHIVLDCPRKFADLAPGALRRDDVQRQQDRRGRVDGHRRGDLLQVDAVEQAHHVLNGIDGHADFAHFAHGKRVVGIKPDLRRQIERDTQSRGSLAQQVLVAVIRLVGVAHAGVLPHGPEPPAIHAGLHTARVGELAGIAGLAVIVPTLQIGRRVQRLDGNVGRGFLVCGWFT
jgi:hypothetical protein